MMASVNIGQKWLWGVVAVLLAFSLLFQPATVHAAGNDPGSVNVDVSGGKLSVSGGGFTNGASAQAWKDFITKYRNFIVGIAGIGAVTMIVLFIVQFLKLGASAGNPQARSQALVGVLWTGIAAAGLGAVTIIVGFFYNSVG
ncbi:hypothetical protein [Geobacillus subterraneus]|uniref:Uncharacterized protein n=1 Tax=Geobacillus subterraneus TaxID=129338 RepID=A0A679FQR6_9BACL|nr:hypothetical protein [Geobacillus subterraneus]BBW98908.1 hypothetical protein GsuE55_37410 [Geobacillus subterraneus]